VCNIVDFIAFSFFVLFELHLCVMNDDDDSYNGTNNTIGDMKGKAAVLSRFRISVSVGQFLRESQVQRIGQRLVCVEQVYELSCVKDNWGRSELLNDWRDGGGIMIMGYEMFRNLSQSARVKNKKQKKIFTETLLDPGHCCAF